MFPRLLVLVALFIPVHAFSQEKKPEPAKGSVTGVAVAKGDHWIEVMPEGAKHARRYVAPWKGTPDAATVAKLKDVAVNQRVKLDWVEADDRPRIAAIEVLKDVPAPEKKPEPEKKTEPKPAEEVVAPPPRPKG